MIAIASSPDICSLDFTMTTPVIQFISKAERQRLQEAEEQQKLAERKQLESENKARKKELLKLGAKGTPEPVLTPMTTDESSHLTEEDRQLIKQRYLGAPSRPIPVEKPKKLNPSSMKFDWNYDLEDTLVEDVSVSGPTTTKRDALDKLDAKSSTVLRHWSQKLSSEMTDRDWRIFKEDFKIYVTGGKVPPPFRSWTESGLPRELLDACYKAGYTKPTPIQMQAIPIAMMPKDMVGISSTGSGKTAAFVLPMLFYIKQLPPVTPAIAADGPYALVLAPSRELALQIEQEATKFSSFCKFKVCSIVGGRSAEQQTLTLSQGVEMIVATPGRLADSLDASQTVLNQCFYVVLDEADKMVDLGFEPYLNRILDSIPPGPRRITQMFSATMPVAVEKLTRKYMISPVTVTVGDIGGGEGKIQIEQRIEFVQSDSDKKRKLFEAVSATEFPVIVFVNSKRNADYVGQLLDNAGYRTMVLHSGKMQQKREDAINQFKSKAVDILVATDVAGRGIDVPDVQHVVNYDMARSIEDYTHRIGRTGRAGKSGIATSFVAPIDDEILPDLKKFLLEAKQFVPEEMQRVVSTTNTIDGEGGAKRKRDGIVYAA